MFLVQKIAEEASWECVKGGSTASIVIILDGYQYENVIGKVTI